ncbi:MAG: FtsQ-type POTRA domain-containing protein [Pseudomonadota bacterium]
MRPVSLRAARRNLQREGRWWRARRAWVRNALLVAVLAVSWPWWPAAIEQAQGALQTATGLVLTDVELHGAVELDITQVKDVLQLEPGMPLLDLDVHAARAKLEEHGWVERATVRRRLPDRLVIEIEEHRPLAVWLGPEGPTLVATSGIAVGTDRLADYRQLPRLLGEEAPAEAPAVLGALARHPELARRLMRAQRFGSGRWRLELMPGVRVELAAGPPAAAIARLAALQADHGVLGRAVAVVDLRLVDRIVVTPWPSLPPRGDG